VLTLVAQGASNKEIARRLGISVHTAKFHVGQLLDKLWRARTALRRGACGWAASSSRPAFAIRTTRDRHQAAAMLERVTVARCRAHSLGPHVDGAVSRLASTFRFRPVRHQAPFRHQQLAPRLSLPQE